MVSPFYPLHQELQSPNVDPIFIDQCIDRGVYDREYAFPRRRKQPIPTILLGFERETRRKPTILLGSAGNQPFWRGRKAF